MTTPAPPPRRDRTSRILFVAILAAIIVPVVWLVLSAALGGPDAVDLERPGTEQLPRLTTTAPDDTVSASTF